MSRVEIPVVVLHPTTVAYVANVNAHVDYRVGGEAPVYAAETGGSPIDQSGLVSDSQGRITAWVERGAYNVRFTIPTFPETVEPFDAAPGKDGAIDPAWIAPNAVTETKINDGAVSVTKIASQAITDAKINNNAGISYTKFGAMSSGQALIGNAGTPSPTTLTGDVTVNATGITNVEPGVVGPTELATDAVTQVKINDNAVGSNEIISGAVTQAKIGTGAVTFDKLTTVLSTSLPASPSDGQVCYYQTAAMAAAGGIVWTLRYNAGSAYLRKWEFIGGSEWAVETASQTSLFSNTTYATVSSPPTITLPLAGDYVARHEGQLYFNTYGGAAGSGVWSGMHSNSVLQHEVRQNFLNGWTAFSGAATIVGASASHVVDIRHRADSGNNGYCYNRALRVRPVRVG